MNIPDFGSDLLGVAARTAVVYVCLVLGFRFLGKREAGQLSTLDLVVLLVISNAVQNAMVGQNTSLLGGLLAAGVILVLDLLLHKAADHWEWLRDFLDGQPTLLVEEGRILIENLRREGISDRELAVALRQNQIMTPEEARFVYLETNGMISVIPYRDGEGPGGDGDEADESSDGRRGEATIPRSGAAGFRRRRRPGRLSGTSG